MVVARKNVRDFRNVVINPRDHFVLPDKRRLSRNDVSELLSNQEFWADNPHMRSLIPQLLEYMVSPYNGKPTVAKKKKVRGGGVWDVLEQQMEELNKQMDVELDDDEPMAAAPPPRRGSTARNPAPKRAAAAADENTAPRKRKDTIFNFGATETNSNMSDAPAPTHTAGTSNDPGVRTFMTGVANLRMTRQLELLEKQKQKDLAAAKQVRAEMAASAEKHREDMAHYLSVSIAAKKELERARKELDRAAASKQPEPDTDSADVKPRSYWRGVATAAKTKPFTFVPPGATSGGPVRFGYPGAGEVNGHDYGTGESKQDEDESPPAPPVMPIPPVSAPVAPPVRGNVSPLSWLMDEAFRQNRTPIIQKLYPLIGSKRAHALPLVDIVKVAGISEDEFVKLTDLHRAGNVMNFPVSDNTGISSNGIPVVHVHGPEQFGPRSNPARPLVIRTNAGTNKIKSM